MAANSAAEICSVYGYKLLSIEDDNENQFVKEQLQQLHQKGEVQIESQVVIGISYISIFRQSLF